MARTGRFGNLPARAPDLTNTIVALMEAYENQRDRNILTAWQKGGDFEGEPVTDQRLKKWFLDRKHEYSKGDPEYDYWSQQSEQVDYDIGESKALLRYAQGGMSEIGMSRWYSSNAQRFPKDSEAWREAMRNAAGYKKAAQEKAHTTTVVSDYEKWTKSVSTIQRNKVDPANKAVDLIDRVLKSMGYQGGDRFMELNAAQKNEANTQIAEFFREGRGQKYARAWERLTGGRFSYRSFQRILRTGKEGSKQQATVSRKFGYSPTQFEEQARSFDKRAVALSVFRSDKLDTYLDARAQYEQDLKDAKSPEQRMAVRADYVKFLRSEQKAFDEMGDEQAAGQVTSELDALQGKAGKKNSPYLGSDLNPGNKAASTIQAGANDELVLDKNGNLDTSAYSAGTELDNAMTRYDQEGIANIKSGKAFYIDPAGDGTLVPVNKDFLKLAQGGIPDVTQYGSYYDDATGNWVSVPWSNVRQSFQGTQPGDVVTVDVGTVQVANLGGHLVYRVADGKGGFRTTNYPPMTGEVQWLTDSNGVRTAVFVNTAPNANVDRQAGDKTAEDRLNRVTLSAGTAAIQNVDKRTSLSQGTKAPDGTVSGGTNRDGTPADGGPAAPTRDQESAWLNSKYGGVEGWKKAYEDASQGDPAKGAAWEAEQRKQANAAIGASVGAGATQAEADYIGRLDPTTKGLWLEQGIIVETPGVNGQGSTYGFKPGFTRQDLVNQLNTDRPGSIDPNDPGAIQNFPLLNGDAPAPVTGVDGQGSPVSGSGTVNVTAQSMADNTKLESIFSDALVSGDATGRLLSLSATAQSRQMTRENIDPEVLRKELLQANGIDPATNPEAAWQLDQAINTTYMLTGGANSNTVDNEWNYMMNHPAGSYREAASRAEVKRNIDAANKDWKPVGGSDAQAIVMHALDANMPTSEFATMQPELADEYMKALTDRSLNQEPDYNQSGTYDPNAPASPLDWLNHGTSGVTGEPPVTGVPGGIPGVPPTGPGATQPPMSFDQKFNLGGGADSWDLTGRGMKPMNLTFKAPTGPNPFLSPIPPQAVPQAAKGRYGDIARFAPVGLGAPPPSTPPAMDPLVAKVLTDFKLPGFGNIFKPPPAATTPPPAYTPPPEYYNSRRR